MPRLNDVFLVGLVAGNPSIKYDKDDNLVQIALPLLVIHGTRLYGEKIIRHFSQEDEIENKGYDNVWVLTENEEIAEQIKKCKPYDIVEIKGVLRVTGCNKKSFCPECSAKHIYPSAKTSVYPIYFSKRADIAARHGIKSFGPEGIAPEIESEIKTDAIAYLKRCIEISNVVRLIGVVCKEPELYQRDSDGRPMLTFPLAVIRKFYISDDEDTDNVDFPYIKLYGKNAKANYDILHKANLILIDGFIQSRNIKRKIICPACGIKYVVADSISEVIPYSVEYIRSNISDTEFGEKTVKETVYRPQKVGSEADIDLKFSTSEERIETDVATVGGASEIDDKVKEALSKLKSE